MSALTLKVALTLAAQALNAGRSINASPLTVAVGVWGAMEPKTNVSTN
ncbi:hypothetical protein [Pseudomonas helleri]